MIKSPPYWSVMALMFGALGLLIARGDSDRVPPSRPLSEFPSTLDGLAAMDQPIPQETLDVLGKGVFLNRVYLPAARNDNAAVGLFIGYFPTQRSGQSIHSPQNCLPGAGWTFLQSGTVDLPNPGGPPHRVGDYLISDGQHQAEVLYWYKTEGRWIANDWAAKYYMLLDSMRYGRTDAALVRITVMVQPGESRDRAQKRAIDFANELAPLLPAYIPD